MLFYLAITLGLAGMMVDAPTTQPASKDLERMQGTWVIESAVLGGKPFSEEVRKITKMVIKDSTYTVTVGQSPDAGTIALDPTQSPAMLDVIGTEGPNKGKIIPCIYEFDGDNLRICYDLRCKARPTEFKSTEGTLHFLVTYKRQS
jgi:uncharacterized protein (TIGR03067 family)